MQLIPAPFDRIFPHRHPVISPQIKNDIRFGIDFIHKITGLRYTVPGGKYRISLIAPDLTYIEDIFGFFYQPMHFSHR